MTNTDSTASEATAAKAPAQASAHLAKAASSLRLYDTASHAIGAFEPVHPGKVGIYVCGATVQSSPHVGHLRAAVAFDVIRRWFQRLGYEVTFVRNVTDIDDKILDKARAAGQQWWARAYHYEREFTRAYDLLGVLPPTYEPRATGHMDAMIDLVQRLLDRGHAYIVPNADGTPSGNVYFDVPSWPEYGALTHQESGTKAADADAEIADRMGPSVDETGPDKYNPTDAADASDEKHDPRDFALWKAPKDTDPLTARWKTPFGLGRPGWHLECSAMSHRYLGDDFDIHGGGLDLRFPHHENEMAQSRAAGWGFAHRWMHSAWVTTKGEKMSKSLGTGLSVDVVLERHPAWVVRYALGSVHYRSMLEWSEQTLDEAEAAYSRIANFVERAGAALGAGAAGAGAGAADADAADVLPTVDEIATVGADALPAEFTAAMNEDVNVANAMAVVFSTVRSGNTLLSKLSDDPESADARAQVRAQLVAVRAMLDVFGLDPLNPQWTGGATGAGAGAEGAAKAEEVLGKLLDAQLTARAEARKARDFAKADAIRDQLAAVGVEIEDSPTGSTWKLA